ncbi:MAG: type II toxin-antitoxin system VapC family toxin [Kiloniellaceae bacterium]
MIVLDTHALLWLDQGSPRLGSVARQAADDALRGQCLAISAVSFWETAVLLQRNRIELDKPVEAWRQELLLSGLKEIPLDGAIAIAAIHLSELHSDPADLFIVATAILSEASLITADRRLLSWAGPLECLDARS